MREFLPAHSSRGSAPADWFCWGGWVCTDNAAGHEALVLVVTGQERRVGSTIAHGHAEALRAADHDVGAPLARWRQLSQRQQICRHTHLRLTCVRLLNNVLHTQS